MNLQQVPNTPPLGDIQKLVVGLTPTDILSIGGAVATSLQILPAPGPGLINIIEEVIANLQFNSVQYATGTGDLDLWYSNLGTLAGISSVTSILPVTAMTNPGSSIAIQRPILVGSPALNARGGVNNPVVIALSAASANYTAGNSGIVITVYYRTLPVNLLNG